MVRRRFRLLGSCASVCTLQLDAASEAWACGIRPGSGASAFNTISPVAGRGIDDQPVGRRHVLVLRQFGMLGFRHQIELDHLASGGPVVDGVIGDFVARVERHRSIGLADGHAELDRAARKIVAADRHRERRIHERHRRVVRIRQRQRRDGVEFRHRREARIGVLGRDARQRQNADQMHDAAQQHARDNREQQPDHGHPTVAIEGIGASRCVRVATPTGVS